jgi:hypothetical protein
MDKRKRYALINFIAAALISFLLIFIGLKIMSNNPLSIQAALMMLGFCVLLGIISSLFYLFRFKAAYIIFYVGILVAVADMYRTLRMDLNGWEVLSALATLFIWIVIGLCAGLIVQLIVYLYYRFKKKDRIN